MVMRGTVRKVLKKGIPPNNHRNVVVLLDEGWLPYGNEIIRCAPFILSKPGETPPPHEKPEDARKGN